MYHRLKRSISHVHGITDPSMIHFMLEDECDDADLSVHHCMTSHVANGQQQLDRYTSYEGHLCCKDHRPTRGTSYDTTTYSSVVPIMLHSITDPSVIYFMLEDGCNDADLSMYYHITSHVASDQ